jgi:hypothetical protein
MGKLMDRLEKQLKTEHNIEAKDCLILYNYLKERDKGHVWSSAWQSLTTVTFKGFPSDERWYKPNDIGYLVLKGLSKSAV